jgi:hypothetical protein
MGSDGKLHDMRECSLVLYRSPASRLKHIIPLICDVVPFPYVTDVAVLRYSPPIRRASSRGSRLAYHSLHFPAVCVHARLILMLVCPRFRVASRN